MDTWFQNCLWIHQQASNCCHVISLLEAWVCFVLFCEMPLPKEGSYDGASCPYGRKLKNIITFLILDHFCNSSCYQDEASIITSGDILPQGSTSFFSFFLISKSWWSSTKLRNISWIYTNFICSKIFPISLLKNDEILPKKTHTLSITLQ
jgi:hypothetical protein